MGVATRTETLPWFGLAVGMAGLAALVAHGLPVQARALAVRARWLVPVACLAHLLPAAPRVVALFAERDHTIARATHQLEGLLLPTAVVTGPLAHALTVGSDLRAVGARHRSSAPAPTHLVVASPPVGESGWRAPAAIQHYQDAGIGLEPVEVLRVRGVPVFLYRLGSASIPLSFFEEAVCAAAHGLDTEAELRWTHLAALDPAHAPALSRLALSLLRRGQAEEQAAWLRIAGAPPMAQIVTLAMVGLSRVRRQELETLAFECLQAALQHDPHRVEARLALATLYARQGLEREVIHHLQAARRSAPDSPAVRAAWQTLGHH